MNYYNPMQDLQNMRERIDRTMQQYQNQSQYMQQQQPQIQQTFQLSNPNQNANQLDGKFVDGVDEAKNTLVFKNTAFFNKDFSKMWFKDVGGSIRTFDLQEEIQVDENVTEINNLKQEINELKALLVRQMNNKPEKVEVAKIEPVTKVVKKSK